MTPSTDHPDSSEDSEGSTSEVPGLSGRRTCCDAAMQRPRKTNEVGLHIEGEETMFCCLTKETHQPRLQCETARFLGQPQD